MKYSVNKGSTLKKFIDAAKILQQEKIELRTYLLFKPPIMLEVARYVVFSSALVDTSDNHCSSFIGPANHAEIGEEYALKFKELYNKSKKYAESHMEEILPVDVKRYCKNGSWTSIECSVMCASLSSWIISDFKSSLSDNSELTFA